MAEAPTKATRLEMIANGMFVQAIKSPHGAFVYYSNYADLERQIAELRAELDRAIDERDEARQEPWPKWADEIRKCLEGYGVDPGDEWDLPEQFEVWITGVVENETARAEVLAEENARLRALPLKDEVERVLEEGRKNTVDVMKALMATGSRDNLLLADAVHRADDAARALLSRLRAGEQAAWRPIETAPKDGTDIWVCGPESTHWESIRYELYDPDVAEEASAPGYWRYSEDLIADVAQVEEGEFTYWMPQAPLPAAPSEHGGERG